MRVRLNRKIGTHEAGDTVDVTLPEAEWLRDRGYTEGTSTEVESESAATGAEGEAQSTPKGQAQSSPKGEEDSTRTTRAKGSKR